MLSNELYSFVTSADGSIINERVRAGEPVRKQSTGFREGVSDGGILTGIGAVDSCVKMIPPDAA